MKRRAKHQWDNGISKGPAAVCRGKLSSMRSAPKSQIKIYLKKLNDRDRTAHGKKKNKEIKEICNLRPYIEIFC